MKPKSKLFLTLFVTGTLFYGAESSFAETARHSFVPGVDRLGGDYRRFDLENPSPALCRSACLDDTRCRAWTFVKPGVQASNARCYLKDLAPRQRGDSCCTSGFYNLLSKIQACRKIGNIEGAGPVTCIGPGGRDFGAAGRTFKSGDEIIILTRFKRLHPGNNKLIVKYSRLKGGKSVNFSNNKRVLNFKNKSENWAFWFPAAFKSGGKWRLGVALDNTWYSEGVIGHVDYCVDCALD